MSRRGSYIAAAAVLVLVCGAILWATRSGATRAGQTGPDALGRDSQRFLPDEIAGVYLGMRPPDLLAVRPKAEGMEHANEPVYVVYNEGLSGGGRALYMFRSGTLKLEKIQIAINMRGVTGIAPRVAAYAKRFGNPSGVWDCPADSSHAPTRRFSWTRGSAGAMDVYLLLGEKVSATWLVASTGLIRETLASARCAATTPDRLTAFPVPAPHTEQSE